MIRTVEVVEIGDVDVVMVLLVVDSIFGLVLDRNVKVLLVEVCFSVVVDTLDIVKSLKQTSVNIIDELKAFLIYFDSLYVPR